LPLINFAMLFYESNKSVKKLLFLLTLVVVLLAFSAGFLFGRMRKITADVTDSDGNVKISKVLDLYGASRSDKISFDQFWSLWNKVKEKYVEQPVDDSKLYYGAMEGMVRGLGDPYSVYFPPKEAAEFTKDLSGEFEGIGAEIGMKENQIVVIAPLVGMPAEKAGVKAGDKIYKIDGVETYDMTVDQAVGKIRGKRGSKVKLSLVRDGAVVDIEIVRETINVPTVKVEYKENNIAYMRLSYFNEKTDREFEKAVKEISAKSVSGIILDLRSNPGGYLETAVVVASEWLKTGSVVSEKFSDGRTNAYDTRGSHRFADIPTVVLVDENSASASEIVAGALQDNGSAKLVGKKTYGKGSVQDFELLPDGSAVKITVAKWFTPKDRQIDKQGIAPDVTVDPMFEVKKDANGKDTEEVIDFGLNKALEILEKK